MAQVVTGISMSHAPGALGWPDAPKQSVRERISRATTLLAESLEVPANRISQIIARKRAISADTALRLARYFGTSADLWMNLQKTYELDLARRQLGKAISHIPQRSAALAPTAIQR